MRSKIILLLLAINYVVFGMDPENPGECKNEPEKEVSNPDGHARKNRVHLPGLLKQYQDTLNSYIACKEETNMVEVRAAILQAKNLRFQIYEHQLKKIEGDQNLIGHYQLALIFDLYRFGMVLNKSYGDSYLVHNSFSELFNVEVPENLNREREFVLNFLLTQIPNDDYAIQLPEDWKVTCEYLLQDFVKILRSYSSDHLSINVLCPILIICDIHGLKEEITKLLNTKNKLKKNYFHQATGTEGSSFIKIVHGVVGTDALMKLLLEEDLFDSTPLHKYCSHNSTGSVEAIYRLVGVDNFIQLLLKEALGNTPLHLAAKKGHHEIFELLLTLAKNDPKLREALRNLFDQIGNKPFTTDQNCALALNQLIDFLYGQDPNEGAKKLDFSSTDDEGNDDTPGGVVSIHTVALATDATNQATPCAFFTNSK